MPYASASEVPSYVPKAKRPRWREVWNSAYDRAKKDGKSDKDAESTAFAEANGVAGPDAHKKFQKLLQKSIESDAQDFTDMIIAELEADFAKLPGEVRSPLESAMLSGVGQGMLQIDVSNAALLAEANTVARDYAADRAAELIGMRYDAEGNLVVNPNAQWAISDTTRDAIRGIVTEAFESNTSIDDIKRDILEALQAEADNGGIFSVERAELIARTEVSNAQARGNYSVWEQSGVVATLRWTTSEDERVCEICDVNDNAVVPIGHAFPSGDKYPGAHPLCRCVIVVEEVTP